MSRTLIDNDEQELFLQDLDQKKRNRRTVKDAYESDSSEDEDETGFNEITSTNVTFKKVDTNDDDNGKNDDDDDDMFASDNEQQEKPIPQHIEKSNSKIKGVKIMNMSEFEKNLEEEENDIVLPDVSTSAANFMNLDKEINTRENDKDIVLFYNNQEVPRLDQKPNFVNGIHSIKEPKMESFSLKQESREGVFDEFGNYIRTKESSSSSDDDGDDYEESIKRYISITGKDSWLSGVCESDISKARATEELRKTESHNKYLENRKKARLVSTEDILNKIIFNLEPVETPMEMLKRFNIQVKKYTKLKDKTMVKSIKSQIKELTNIVEILLDRFSRQVYDLTREELVREYKKITGKSYSYNINMKNNQADNENRDNKIQSYSNSNPRKRKLSDFGDSKESPDVHTANQARVCSSGRSSGTEKNQADNPSVANEKLGETANSSTDNSTTWEYKWSLGDDDDNEIYGPFDTETMIAWKESYFQENIAYARRVEDTNGDYIDVRDINFMR